MYYRAITAIAAIAHISNDNHHVDNCMAFVSSRAVAPSHEVTHTGGYGRIRRKDTETEQSGCVLLVFRAPN